MGSGKDEIDAEAARLYAWTLPGAGPRAADPVVPELDDAELARMRARALAVCEGLERRLSDALAHPKESVAREAALIAIFSSLGGLDYELTPLRDTTEAGRV